MSATYYTEDGVTVVISDIARQRLAAEQRDIRHDQQRAERLTWGLAASVVCIAVLIIKHLVGV